MVLLSTQFAQASNLEVIPVHTPLSNTTAKQSPNSGNSFFKDSFNLPTSLRLSYNHPRPSHYHFSLGQPPKSFPKSNTFSPKQLL